MNRIFQGELDRIAFGKSGPITRPSLPSLPSFSAPQESAMNKISHIWIYSGIAQKVALAFVALFVVALILVFVHFFIKPIFPQALLTNIPGFKDEKLFWTNGTDIVSGNQNPFNNQSTNYTLMVDTQIDYPTSTVGAPRLLLYRGEEPCKLTGLKLNETLLTILPSFNFAIHMDKEINDVYVSVMTSSTSSSSAPESISITNYPVEKPIRLTVVVTGKLMEVYLNGALYKTKTFDGQVNDIRGSIFPIPSILSESSMPFGRVKNLRLWNRVLNANEIRAYGGSDDFPSVMRVADSRSTTQCPTSIDNSLSSGIGSLAGLDLPNLLKDTSSSINKIIKGDSTSVSPASA